MTEPAEALARRLGYFTEAEVCTLLDIAPGTLEAWRKRNRGPNYSLGGNRFLYQEAELIAWLESRTRHMSGDSHGHSADLL